MVKVNKRDQHLNVIVNKKSKYQFFISETFEAGLILLGWEVQSIRKRSVNISNSYISIKSNEGYLVNSQFNYTLESNVYIERKCNRIRKILLHKHQILYLSNKLLRNKCSIVPLSIYFKNNWCKLKIGIVKGKTIQDKREHAKKNDWKKQQRTLINNL